MARIARVVAPGLPHPITQRGNRRQPTFFCDDDYWAYIGMMAEWCPKCGVEVWAYCLMPKPCAPGGGAEIRGGSPTGPWRGTPKVYSAHQLQGGLAGSPVAGGIFLFFDGRKLSSGGRPVCGAQPCPG